MGDSLGGGCGRIPGKGGRLSKALLDLWWGMGLGLAFGMICGVETQFLRWFFQFYLVLLVRRMPHLWIISRSWVVPISEM